MSQKQLLTRFEVLSGIVLTFLMLILFSFGNCTQKELNKEKGKLEQTQKNDEDYPRIKRRIELLETIIDLNEEICLNENMNIVLDKKSGLEVFTSIFLGIFFTFVVALIRYKDELEKSNINNQNLVKEVYAKSIEIADLVWRHTTEIKSRDLIYVWLSFFLKYTGDFKAASYISAEGYQKYRQNNYEYDLALGAQKLRTKDKISKIERVFIAMNEDEKKNLSDVIKENNDHSVTVQCITNDSEQFSSRSSPYYKTFSEYKKQIDNDRYSWDFLLFLGQKDYEDLKFVVVFKLNKERTDPVSGRIFFDKTLINWYKGFHRFLMTKMPSQLTDDERIRMGIK